MKVLLVIFVLFYPLFLGIGLVTLYTINVKTGVIPSIPYRALLSFGLLVFFTTLLSYIITQGATGARNPYLKNRQDAYFFQRVPLEPSIMYFSSRVSGFLLTTALLIPFVVLSFGPLMIALNLPLWRIGGVLLTFFLTFNMTGDLADLAFFTLRKHRRRGKWVSIWLESKSPFFVIVLLAVPVTAFLLFQQNLIPAFTTLTDFFFVPFVNSATSATGFFFRSGIPLESWFALFSLFIENGLLSVIMIRIAVKHKPMEDITELIPVLSIQEARVEELSSGKTIAPPELANENIQGNVSFNNRSPLKAYLQKDWLAIKRIRPLRNYFYLAPVFIVIFSIGVVFLPKELFSYLIWIIVFPMIEFSLLLARIEVKDPMQRFAINNMDKNLSKFLVIFIGSIIYGIPLLILGGPPIIGVMLLVAFLSTIIGKKPWGMLKIRMIMIFMTIFVSSILLYPIIF